MPDNDDIRRKRIMWRANHRGTKELDLVLGRFARESLGELGSRELDDFEALLEVPEVFLTDWLSNRVPVPDEFNTAVFQKVAAISYKIADYD